MLLHKLRNLTHAVILCGAATLSTGFAQTAPASGSGPYAAPLAATYSDLTNAAKKIVDATNLKNQRVVIYDQPTFSTLSSYQVALDQLRRAMESLCQPVSGARAELVTLDIGGAASGLGALITALTPGYAIQGQAVTFDNTALLAAFAHAVGNQVIFPTYLAPAAQKQHLTCAAPQGYETSSSVADLWYASLAQAAILAGQAAAMPETTDAEKARKKAVQDRVDKFQKIADALVAIDKGPSALSKLLTAETLLDLIRGQSSVSVIDLRLDGAGNDSFTKTFLWWKWTRFNSTVMAHYTKMAMSYDGKTITLRPETTNSVIILSRVASEPKFGTSEAPLGAINAVNPE